MVVVLVELLTSKQTHGESIFNNAQVEDFKWLPQRHISWNEEIQGIEVKTLFFFSFKIILVYGLWIIILLVVVALAAGSILA